MRTACVCFVSLLLCLALWSSLGVNPVAAQGTNPPVHVVQAGDTLSAIAARFGTSVAGLAAANGLSDPDRLVIGQRLVIPSGSLPATVADPGPATVLRYIVKPGETLGSIARRWGLAESALLRANGTALAGRRLFPGQEVQIPLARVRSRAGLGELGLHPLQVVQGRAATLHVRVPATDTLQARYAGVPLALAHDGEQAWGLFGVHPLTPPGTTWLDIDIAAAAVPRSLANAVDQGWLRVSVPVVIRPGTYTTQHLVLPPAKGELLEPVRLADERAKLNTIWPQNSLAPQWTAVFTRPLALEFPVTSPFGTRRSYNGGPVSSFHEGQDFGAPEGTPVLAPAAGHVVLAETLAVRGNAVIIDHGAGLHTGYWHLSKIDVEPGQTVKPGDKLGEVGTTGLSTGWHLHWEARVGLTPVDPLPFLEQGLP